MATGPKTKLQNRKRQQSEADLPQDSLPSKRLKSIRARRLSNFPPGFYDSLPRLWLTRRALRELDRRNQLKSSDCAQASVRPFYPKDIQRFARHGGPELSELRGYPEPTEDNLARTMSSRRSSQSKQSKSVRPSGNSASQTSITASSNTRSTAYDKNFERYMINENVFPEGYEYPDGIRTPEPNNEDELEASLARSRPSLSPSRFTNEDFRRFKRDNARVYEGSVMGTVFPTIRGQHTEIPHELDAPFAALASITKEVITTAQPDFYDGTNPGNIDKQVRDELGSFIIPTIHARAPAVPNFFLEAKPPSGNVDVAKRQATLNGALGARAMHMQQSYAVGESIYDGNAYTISSTYHNGHLQMYTTHITPPAGPGDLPEYHMNQRSAYAMTHNADTCRQGLTVFRNGRDYAKEKRDRFISAANERARSMHAERSTLDLSHYSRASRTTYLPEEYETSADELAAASFPYRAEEAEPSEDELAPTYPVASSLSYYNEEPEASANEPASTTFYEEEEPESSEDELTTSFSKPTTTSYSYSAKSSRPHNLANIIAEVESSAHEVAMATHTDIKKRPSNRSEKISKTHAVRKSARRWYIHGSQKTTSVSPGGRLSVTDD